MRHSDADWRAVDTAGMEHSAYRKSGATLPWGSLEGSHGVAMEGYFWRITDVATSRVVVALIGVNQGPRGPWATLGLAGSPGGFLRLGEPDGAEARVGGLGARSGDLFAGDDRSLRVNLGPDAQLEARIEPDHRWPRALVGGSSAFQSVPGLNQYWHPWLLGGRASGVARLGGATWEFTDAQIYGEKNWGKEGFPDSWWWGQAQGFDEPDVCVAFAGGEVVAGPLRTTVTGLVVRLPGGRVVRLGNPAISPVQAEVGDEHWRLRGRGYGYRIEVDAHAPLADAHVLPVPLPSQHRNTAGAIEHLAGTMSVQVSRRGRLLWAGTTQLAGLEHGGLARAEAELRRRGVEPGAVGAG